MRRRLRSSDLPADATNKRSTGKESVARRALDRRAVGPDQQTPGGITGRHLAPRSIQIKHLHEEMLPYPPVGGGSCPCASLRTGATFFMDGSFDLSSGSKYFAWTAAPEPAIMWTSGDTWSFSGSPTAQEITPGLTGYYQLNVTTWATATGSGTTTADRVSFTITASVGYGGGGSAIFTAKAILFPGAEPTSLVISDVVPITTVTDTVSVFATASASGSATGSQYQNARISLARYCCDETPEADS